MKECYIDGLTYYVLKLILKTDVQESAEALAYQIEKLGVKSAVCQADLKNQEDLEKLFKTLDKSFPPLKYFVNNATAVNSRKSFEELTLDEIRAVFEVNFFGASLCLKEAIKRMKINKQGSIVNISSQVACFGGNKLTAYASSKGAINSLTIALAKELGCFNIRVNAISPGVIATHQHTDKSTEWIEQVKRQIPLERLGTPDEIARVVLWLLSDESSYLTGTIIPVTGGR